jgi:hypothetical protein
VIKALGRVARGVGRVRVVVARAATPDVDAASAVVGSGWVVDCPTLAERVVAIAVRALNAALMV